MTLAGTRRRGAAAPWVLAGLCLVPACNKDDASSREPVARVRPAAPDQAQAAEPSPPVPQEGDDGCRDWSEVDPSSLPALPESPHTATFEAVWRTVLEKHYDPTLGCTDWPALRLSYGRKVASAQGTGEAARIMNELLERLGQSHFRVISPMPESTLQLQGPARPALTARWINGHLMVTASSERKVPAGALLQGIDGHSVESLVNTARQASRRPEELPFRVRRQAEAALSCPPEGKKTVRFLDPRRKDAEVSRTVECELPPGERLSLGNLREVPSNVESRRLSGGPVGYLAFNVWMLPLVSRVQQAVADLRTQGITALIIDLRGNPGGVGPMSVPVARLLLADGGSLGTMKFRDFTNEFKVSPNPDAFRGPVVVLIDEGTASTSEIFVAGMRDLGRVTVIGGQRSAGAALPSLIEQLPGGAVLQYVVGDYHSPKGTAVEGQGLLPDVLVEERREDFIEGRDPVLDASIHYLENA